MGHIRGPQANADLDDIWLYLVDQTGNIELANRVLESITARFYALALSPYIGPARNDVQSGVRIFPAENYVIVYEVHEGDVLILRVLHAKRDIDSLLG